MPKPKLSDFKKLLAEMTEEELRTELLKLFSKLEQVQIFYAQDLIISMTVVKRCFVTAI